MLCLKSISMKGIIQYFFSFAIFTTILLLSFSSASLGQNEDDISKKLLGKWILQENERAVSGEIIFLENNKYELIEILKDKEKTKVSRKGSYVLNTKSMPVRIDLCLGDCSQPGSEWVTLFSIMRFVEEDQLEIRASSGQEHPTEFSNEKIGSGTMLFTRDAEKK
jgi:hypothetical protein